MIEKFYVAAVGTDVASICLFERYNMHFITIIDVVVVVRVLFLGMEL